MYYQNFHCTCETQQLTLKIQGHHVFLGFALYSGNQKCIIIVLVKPNNKPNKYWP